MRTETLVESRPTELEISAEEAQALAALGQKLASDKTWWGEVGEEDLEESGDDRRRSVIKVSPSGPGKWQVTVVDAVGVAALPELQLVVAPKIPISHLLFLFSESGDWPKLDDQAIAQLASADDLAELVAYWYLNCLERVLRLDLVRDYRPTEDDLDSVRGQIVPLPTAALYYSGRLSAHCEFEEFDVDTPLNRVLKAAAQAILGNPGFSPDRTRRAIRFVSRMSEVGPLRAADIRVAHVDRRTAHCREALVLARHVLRSNGRTLTAGLQTARSFLIRTPEMVEQGIRNYLDRALRPTTRVTKEGRQLEGSTMRLTPDLMFRPAVAVGDVKYQLTGQGWSRSHIYQGVTFATGFWTPNGLVISFSENESAHLDEVRVGGVRVHSAMWKAIPSLVAEEAANDLLGQVQVWLQTISLPAAAAG